MSKNLREKNTKKKSNEPVSVSDEHRVRLRLVGIVMVAVFSVISLRFVQFQFDPDLRFSKEDVRHVGMKLIKRPRGAIYDANGRPLAIDRKVPSLSINPDRVENAAEMVLYLAGRLNLDPDDIRERVTRTNDEGHPMKFVWLKRRMTTAEVQRLGNLEDSPDPDALLVQYESIRFYPEKELAAQVVGFSNQEGLGAEGLEAKFNKHLYSHSGKLSTRVDRDRRVIERGDFEAPTGGSDVALTIDSELQFTLEQELDAAMDRNNAKRSMGLLMDPDTGAILAMATRPAFDPNEYGQYDGEVRRNRAVVDFFEPGSAFKIVTAAAALELGLVTRETPIDCMNGRFRPVKRRVVHDTHPMGVAPFSETFAQSSNIAIIKVAALLGEERLESWIRRFGFGSRTGLEVPLESGGYFAGRQNWSGYSMSSLPMGQEIGVTMPQLAQAFSIIANGGLTVKPHMVRSITSHEGEEVYRFDPGERQRVISENTARIMRELAHQVIASEHGTGKRAAIEAYRAGGKTGTAQIAIPGGKGYYDDRYTTVFAGFAPVIDPKITCVIVVQEPMIDQHYGGFVCGPVFRKVVERALVKLNVPEDPMDPEFFKRNKNLFAKEERDADTMDYRGILDLLEPMMDEEPADAMELVTAAVDRTAEGERLPDFKGLTKRQARLKALELGIEWYPQGAGFVVRQEPVQGTLLKDVRVCKLIFGRHVNSDDA